MLMLNAEVDTILHHSESIYAVVIAVAKRSRDIAELAMEEKRTLRDKPINVAIEEFAEGKIRVAN